MYENLIKEILSYFSITKPPVKPDLIAYGLGIDITVEKLPEKVSGLLYLSPKIQVIIVNREHPRVRQRFTVAHELGHFFLHQKNPVYTEYLDKEEDTFEYEANTFAGNLLLPDFMLKKYIYLPLEKIADIFFVSKSTVEHRLKYFK
ncbi:MAG TPA: ImmA/IrrE family metallo-endopeptidase [Dictyoglomaceae bacterium]|nr:ImmA/IrrE family metallo-endopeptidase [Dictyoglomaceae bacterium]HOL39072.1 ImmA/IrrE family metallo-endopeptidase [Dictyoglomaceae bacterium]HOP94411.1 ImmA/IrrE family metallo-endopeptidase [Dictyoglomaceae bacterium]HPP15752.1 ImmA/IrrE family metallo-endopeptidase [Dictyoglomaceae bacterium]HPU42740.1 ImmA/IrrE family metallo-endopeptidase [Dictyoglomaceae bacterium]